ncbi:hypothetical protein CspeluHIS016_0201440 [Cutaneotrichosporon spelunceum]|uniref:Uncharacterized protein n=1 Tax=Cutaneotrichosporon spelunceum TaxID=1672016 RepID=A0AAD3YAI9_9TREE|nr:hypothetical protein CspeluHIS016_0201440 [Cutaneotrichosporon spelunceum]
MVRPRPTSLTGQESVSAHAEHETESDLDEPPTDNELRLAARVLELERERDRLADQLRDMQSQYPAHSTTIPVPDLVSDSAEPIHVPPALIPVLSLVRDHIQELARDNAALRYTFLGPNRVSPGSSIATTPLSVDSPQTADASTLPLALPVPSAGLGPPSSVSVGPTEASSGLDLAAVVERVRTLILENDELGDMVAEAGRVDGEEWLRTLDESKAMIGSLDAELTNNLTVVDSLRVELDAYKDRFGPLDGSGRSIRAERGERASRGGRNARRNGRQDDLYRPASEDGQRERERDRDRASIALERASETLASLGRRLTELNGGNDPKCCCCRGHECAARSGADVKLKLCGEIGTALLQRCEALELKHTRAEHQVEMKRKALADSLRHVANLERANTTHLTKYTELSHAFEALEKKYTQAEHSQTLTQQSLTHVRNQLSRARATATVHSAAGAGAEERSAEMERRFEDARDLLQAESRRLRDQIKWRKMAEERIADLELKLTASGHEVEEIKAARAKDAKELLANAKERLEALHAELSETLHAEAPSEQPEYQRTLEDLVATNALLKHDTSELAVNLAEKMEENRQLREELEELRARSSEEARPLSTELRPLLMSGAKSHIRTGSNPVVGNEISRPMHARVASAAMPRIHQRQTSLAPSVASSSTPEPTSVTSSPPHDNLSGTPMTSTSSNPISPEQRRSARSSFSGGLPYTLNGVVKSKRSTSGRAMTHPTRRSVQIHALDDLAEAGTGEADTVERMLDTSADHSNEMSTEVSSATDADDTDSQSEVGRRKRTSVLLPAAMRSPKTHYDSSPMMDAAAFEAPAHFPFPNVKGERRGRRTLTLLSRSTGVQTDSPPDQPTPIPEALETDLSAEFTFEVGSAQHSRRESRVVSGGSSTPRHTLGELVDFLSKVLVKLRGVHVRTLHGRLKKHNLPGDVGHVSRTTIASLRTEISDMRHRFRYVLDSASTTRRDMTLLLKLLKDVFDDLLELQGVVNDVTVNPKLAKQLRAKAFADDAGPPPTLGAGLGWIAAPIANWLIPPTQTSAPQPSPTRSRASKPAPKLQASTSATTTTVSVEFGGAGSMVRRAAPATPKKTRATAMVGAADVFGSLDTSQRSVSAAVKGSDPEPVSLRRHASLTAPGRRTELMGIFAGAARDHNVSTLRATGRIRHASSQHFSQKTDARRGNRLSTVVDAVLDPDDAPQEPVFTRLRPRGLSDSSIRSTVVIPTGPHDAEPVPIPSFVPSRYSVGAVAVLAESLGSGLGSLGSLGRRIYGHDDSFKQESQLQVPNSEREPTDTDAEADAEAEGEIETPRPRRVRRKKRSTEQLARRSSERLAKSAERLAQSSVECLAPPTEEGESLATPGGSRTPTATTPLRAPRTPSRTSLAPSLAIPAIAAGGTSPLESAGGFLERLAEDRKGLRTLNLRGSVRTAKRWA